MSVEECKECRGTGAKDGGACPACQGNGVMGVDISPVDPSTIAEATPVKEIAAPKAKFLPSYYPDRWIKTMGERTLEKWREDLEEKKKVVQAEMDKLNGGLLQIENELDRRASLKR